MVLISFTSGVTASNLTEIDSINYVDEGIDPDLARDTFKMIFDNMEQIQHYEMMMAR